MPSSIGMAGEWNAGQSANESIAHNVTEIIAFLNGVDMERLCD